MTETPLQRAAMEFERKVTEREFTSYRHAVQFILMAIREPDEETAHLASDIAHTAVNSNSGETCPVFRNHVRSYIDAILKRG